MTPFIQANTNGRLHAANEPSIAPLNRGFLYGDAIYEVWRTYGGVIFAWEAHWDRLERSAEALFLELPFSRLEILEEIRRTVAAFREYSRNLSEVYIRLQVSRGGGPIGLDTGLADRADFTLLVQENKLFSEEKFRAGLTLSLARELRRNAPGTLNPAWKTGNYLNNILCLREARARGADEVVILNLAGEITEAAVSNIAFVRRDGVVITPPLTAGILAGITRALLIHEIGPAAGVSVKELTVTPADLADFSECFLLSTTKDVTPVAAIDEQRFQLSGDSVTLRLKKAFAEYAHVHSETRTDLRLW